MICLKTTYTMSNVAQQDNRPSITPPNLSQDNTTSRSSQARDADRRGEVDNQTMSALKGTWQT